MFQPTRDQSHLTTATTIQQQVTPSPGPQEWTVEDVAKWLTGKGFLEDVIDKLTECEITGADLFLLNDGMLKLKIDVASPDDRRGILAAIEELRLQAFNVAKESKKRRAPFLEPRFDMRWLEELHSKLWGREDLIDQVFRAVHLTKEDFVELQHNLHDLSPRRNHIDCISTDVLEAKIDFLRSRTATRPLTIITESLVPKVVLCKGAMDVDEHREGRHDEDSEGVDDEAGEAEVVVVADRSYIDEDAAVLSHGPTAVLPCTVRYMDLTCLNLQYFGRVSKVLLIRDEWDAVIDIFNARKKGIKGSALWTGQPGIGKTSLLFYILVICLIKAQPIIFQNKSGVVYTIDDQVRKHLGSSEHFLKPDVLTLVDGDGKVGEPHDDLTSALNFRILLTSFPRPKTDRRWLTQDVHDPLASFVVGPWQWEEFAIASIFLSESDITLRRLRKTAKVCGYIPRTVFLAAESPKHLTGQRR